MIFSASPVILGELIDSAEKLLAARLPLLGGEEPRLMVEIIGDPGLMIDSLGAYDDPLTSSSLSFAVKKDFLVKALEGEAGAVLTTKRLFEELQASPQNPPQTPKTLVLAEDPRLLFAAILELTERGLKPQNSDEAPYFKDYGSVSIDPSVSFGPHCYVGANVVVKKGVLIGPRVVIEDEVTVDEDSIIHPGAILRWRVKLGKRVIIHAGCVIGDDGFGYTQIPQKNGRLIHFKNPHLGSVAIEDDVEIGALSCVDRGLVGDTTIGKGTKLDNLVQVGHNCRIGSDCVVVAQTGVGGHAAIGDRAFLLGQSGISHGAVVGQDAIVTGQCGVTGTIPPGKRAWSGTPSVPMDEDLKTQALLRRYLPRLRDLSLALKSSESFEELKEKLSSAPKVAPNKDGKGKA
jgi:UDP-3-O-[3-hydroxymyristoyl] glucosamine N-acyltransferase